MRGVVFLDQLSTVEKERRKQLPLSYYINKERFSLDNIMSNSNQPQVVRREGGLSPLSSFSKEE